MHFHLRDLGLKTRKSFDYFDSYALDDSGTPRVAIKVIRNSMTSVLTKKLTQSSVPVKVVLVEGKRPAFVTFKGNSLFLSSTGTGVFVRNVGWVITPTRHDPDFQKEIRLKMSPRWSKEDGVWLKTCTNCGARKEPDEFYKNPNKGMQDPTRNHCKVCTRKKQAERNARK